jgi:hypothetical protein
MADDAGARCRSGGDALAYDQQVLLAKTIRLETEIILLQAEGSQ